MSTSCARSLPYFLDLPPGKQTLCIIKHGDWSACLDIEITPQQPIRIGDEIFSSKWCEKDSPACQTLEPDPVSRTAQMKYWTHDQEERVSFLPGGLMLVTKLLNRDTKLVRQVSARQSRSAKLRQHHLLLARDLSTVDVPSEVGADKWDAERIEIRSQLGPDDWSDDRSKLLTCHRGESCTASYEVLRKALLADLEASELIATCPFTD